MIHRSRPHVSRQCSVVFLAFILVTQGRGQERIVDFRYAPSESCTLICLPFDWLKTAVNSNGALMYDFGPGPYGRGLTSITFGVRGDSLQVTGQSYSDPRIPVLTTHLAGHGLTIDEQAFALVPEKPEYPPATWRGGTIRRTAGLNGCIGWASPPDSVDEAFQNAAWGAGRPIRYTVRVKPGSAKRVALGVIEPHKWAPGVRLIELRVEGAPPQIIDPMGDNVRNRPHVLFFNGRDVNGDGWLAIESHAPMASPDFNMSLCGFWIFPEDAAIDTASVLNGTAARSAETYFRCGTEAEENAPAARVDVLSSHIEGAGEPYLLVSTKRPLTYERAQGLLRYRGRPFLLCTPEPVGANRTPAGWVLDFPKGTRDIRVLASHGGKADAPAPRMPDISDAVRQTAAYWLHDSPVPRGRIIVPDSMMQYLIDVNTRNMYQVADVVDGARQFQPGPTMYRGLWTGDVSLIGGTLLALGDTSATREFLEACLPFQLPSGQIRALFPPVSLSETPGFLYGACWYAETTGNRDWLLRHWDALRSAARWIDSVRISTLDRPDAPFAGLFPPGFVDGGISVPAADYSTAWWALIAIERAAGAARWIGEESDAVHWDSIRDAFVQAWERAARRDIHVDRKGLPFLPACIGDTSTSDPQKGQFAILLPARFPSHFSRPGTFADSVVRMNLRMMENYEDEGMVAGSGWLKGGLWTWLGQIQGTDWALEGEQGRGYDYLYASANHASTAGTWVEEQLPRSQPPRTTGDFSDAEGSAVFVHLVRVLLATEIGDTLHLLHDLPGGWIHGGAKLELNDIATDLGHVTFRMAISPGGDSALLTYVPTKDGAVPGHIRVDLATLSRGGFHREDGSSVPGYLDIRPDRPWTLALRMVPAGRN